ncbi:PLC-like phosphodiesterase [Zopfia rhizophila CBS 207.26]|uniref:PLC-like phosphodiesterase n=1 Tax=Zopfia rhizophila CBS 207.26 TaxID=1314779 RepID=A0A6A6DJC9_9PEZI|nr:PLC-like phosphodiesterase [Zopfia rhizophila CBS 207.26]
MTPSSSIWALNSRVHSTSAIRLLTGINSIPAPSALPSATSGTSSTPRPRLTRNKQPCNGHVEFCNRKFSNVSMVVTHNSPFVVPHNIASNQELYVLQQLHDGIRGLQFETRMFNGTLSLCHTTCDLLNVGTLEAYLRTVACWLKKHPYEVISIMMGNGNRVAPTTYIAPFKNAGLLRYVYTPPSRNMTLDQWPTLSEMILENRRVVVMLDYLANQTQVPWLLDEFAYQWQTQFSPTDANFPCTVQRPVNQPPEVSRNYMYMANHNLNVVIPVRLGDNPVLIPAYTLLKKVNAVQGNGSLGRHVDDCIAMWGRPPNWLLVDYYNYGNFNGSVFQVAASANNVSYDRKSCCETVAKSEADIGKLPALLWRVAGIALISRLM